MVAARGQSAIVSTGGDWSAGGGGRIAVYYSQSLDMDPAHLSATVKAAASGCRGVSVTVHGTEQPALDGSSEFVRQLAALLHVHWPGIA